MLGVPSFCRFAPFSPTAGRRYYSYGAHGGLLQSMSYGNGDSVEYSYDALARMENVYYNESVNPSLGYGYAANGALGSLTDYDNERLYVYGYDGLDRLLSMTETSDGDAVQVFHADYDAANRVSSTGYRVSPGWDGALGEPRSYGYSYSSTNGSLSSMTLPGGGAYAYSYDGLRRLSSRSLSVSNSLFLTKEYGYLAGAGTNGTTTLVNSLTVKGSDGSTLIGWSYTYDAAGRITSVSDGVRTWSFVYDTQGQLLSETRDNGYSSQTWTYSYDTGGNLRGWTGGGSSGSYTYGNAQWPDLLTAYNGNPISYDGAGNPTTWYDGSAMTWDKGRRLTSVSGSKTLQFTYSADGLRLTKTVGTGNEAVTHYYTWQGDKLIAEAFGDTEKEFFYDESGRPYALLMRDLSTATPTEAWYYYVTNLQGDVMMLLDANGAEVAHYRYDAWGMMQAMGGRMAAKNPIRYRGYYYDVETKFYYLQSRYYDPKIGRFINADAFASTGQGVLGANMFAYCGNEPVGNLDADGCEVLTALLVGGAVLLTALVIWTVATPAGQEAVKGLTLFVNELYCDLHSLRIHLLAITLSTVNKSFDYLLSKCASRANEEDDVCHVSRIGKQTGKAPRNNRNQNEQFAAIVKLLGLTYDQARQLHDEISKMGYSYRELLEIARNLFNK